MPLGVADRGAADATRLVNWPFHRDKGSSARAEIDPRSVASLSARKWLLRTRGDRPIALPACCERVMAPPHARRSTRHPRRPETGDGGSSARAEIDLAPAVSTVLDRRLLRPRGDRPVWSASACDVRLAPPHARRSTRRATCRRSSTRGSSARAEIDPSGAPENTIAWWLLRTRGDRPAAGNVHVPAAVAPPHARRSTRAAIKAEAQRRGSSARAEIDPSSICAPSASAGLLRTRGDRPIAERGVVDDLAAPPHARRSTSGPRRLPACSELN